MWKVDDIVKGLQKRIAEALDKAKVEDKIAVADIAKHLGITEGSIRHWKYGRNSLRLPHLLEFAKFLGLNPVQLIFGSMAKDPYGFSQRVIRIAIMLENIRIKYPQEFSFLEDTVDKYISVSIKE